MNKLIEKDHSNEDESFSSNKKQILSDKYIIIKKLGSGSFGEVYLAQHKNGGFVAAKFEERKKIPRIINEYNIYKYLHKHKHIHGIPKVYDFIQTCDYNIMFMQLLGPSLEDLVNKYDKQFKFSSVFKLADQLISVIQNMHDCKFIHRDIKPNNFLIGRENPDQVYIMDFGLSKKYIMNNQHIKFRNNRSLIGTARYASINMHLGIEPSRRDDLESIGYMLIYFIKGSLPWQGLKKKRGVNNLEKIGEIKMCTNLNNLCDELPECFKNYLLYCRNLKFDEDPDYKYLKHIFKVDAHKLNIHYKYEWE
ncbi:Protein kinase [uncultured virus]|nr:Protein kinase [uncultured virus]